MLIKDTCPLAAEILNGEHDAILDYVDAAIKARKKDRFRPGTKWMLKGTRNVSLEGKTVTVIKANAKNITVGLGERDQFGFSEGEYNVSQGLLAPVTS